MKSLDEIQDDMSKLYDQVFSGERELKIASELANIAGKNLKAYQLQLARDIFLSHRPTGNRQLQAAPAINGASDVLDMQ